MSLRLRDKACETLYLFTKRVRETALIMIQMKGHTDRKDTTWEARYHWYGRNMSCAIKIYIGVRIQYLARILVSS